MATPTIEEYLETIYNMEQESPPAISARVAEAMGVSRPTITDTLRRMAQQGYVTVGEEKQIRLTDRGREVAEALVRRHRLWERWLVDVLGMDWAKVHEEACRLEHALSPEVEERLANHLNRPATCPHGNPIPGMMQPPQADTVPMNRVAPGDKGTVARVSQSSERDPRLLDYLRERGVVPGARFAVTEVAPWAGVITLSVDGATVILGAEAASHVRVSVDQRTGSA